METAEERWWNWGVEEEAEEKESGIIKIANVFWNNSGEILWYLVSNLCCGPLRENQLALCFIISFMNYYIQNEKPMDCQKF